MNNDVFFVLFFPKKLTFQCLLAVIEKGRTTNAMSVTQFVYRTTIDFGPSLY